MRRLRRGGRRPGQHRTHRPRKKADRIIRHHTSSPRGSSQLCAAAAEVPQERTLNIIHRYPLYHGLWSVITCCGVLWCCVKPQGRCAWIGHSSGPKKRIVTLQHASHGILIKQKRIPWRVDIPTGLMPGQKVKICWYKRDIIGSRMYSNLFIQDPMVATIQNANTITPHRILIFK